MLPQGVRRGQPCPHLTAAPGWPAALLKICFWFQICLFSFKFLVFAIVMMCDCFIHSRKYFKHYLLEFCPNLIKHKSLWLCALHPSHLCMKLSEIAGSGHQYLNPLHQFVNIFASIFASTSVPIASIFFSSSCSEAPILGSLD